MDPFLEHPLHFPGLHDRLITAISDALQPQLPHPYYAEIGQQLWVLPLDECREIFLEIRRRGEGDDRVVTSIEVLCLSNKTPGEHGRDLYLQKQHETLHSQTHLVEIDLLRGGTHTTAVPLEWLVAKAGRCDYHVSVHCFDRPRDYLVYPNLLPDPLPEINVPLLPGDGFVPLDLQMLFAQCYDRGPYRRKVRYRLDDLDPPVLADRRSWVAQRLSKAASQ
jgi:hypothetical protein